MIRKKRSVKKSVRVAKTTVAKAAQVEFKVMKFPFGTIQIDKSVLVDLSCLFPPKTARIITLEGGDPHPESQKAHRGYLPDRIMWFNKDKRGHTIKFSNWPFKEPVGPIFVPAGGYSGMFTIAAAEELGDHKYTIDDGPPGGPEIEVVP